jgi:hypothetical protein
MQYLRAIQANDDDSRRGLRALGGLLLGVGVFVLAYRRSSLGDPWGDFALFLVALLPALFLYGGGLLAALSSPERSAWHGVFLVFGLIFAVFTFFQFLELIDGNTGDSWNVAWIFAAVAALGVVAALLADVRFAMLAAGVAFIVAWFALWDAILGEDFSSDAGTIRGFSMLAAGVLAVAAVGLHWQRRGRHLNPPFDDEHGALPSELLTAAGLAFLFGAGILSATAAIVQSILGAFAPLGATAGGGFAEPSVFWDIVLLAGSLGLVVFGVFFRVRGPAYVGAIGLTIFIVIVGLDLDDSSPSGSLLGWPLVLLILAAAALAASVLMPRRDGVATAPAAEPGPPPPPAGPPQP